jgi:hypothetical protein
MFWETMCPSSGADDCVVLSPHVGIVPWLQEGCQNRLAGNVSIEEFVLRTPQWTHYLQLKQQLLLSPVSDNSLLSESSCSSTNLSWTHFKYQWPLNPPCYCRSCLCTKVYTHLHRRVLHFPDTYTCTESEINTVPIQSARINM